MLDHTRKYLVLIFRIDKNADTGYLETSFASRLTCFNERLFRY